MFKNISVTLYRKFLQNARRQHDWKPMYVDYKLKKEGHPNKFLHCVWLDPISGRTIYNVTNYYDNNSYIHSYLCFIKFLLHNKNVSLEGVEWLFWLLKVQKTNLQLKHISMQHTK